MINLLQWQQIASEFAPDTSQTQTEKPRFETETSVLNWDFHILDLIIPSLHLSEKQLIRTRMAKQHQNKKFSFKKIIMAREKQSQKKLLINIRK